MTQSDVLIRYSEAKEALGGGCSDGYCCVEKPTGMHTNGGCKCASNPDFLRQQRMANIMRLAQEMSSEITRLRAALAEKMVVRVRPLEWAERTDITNLHNAQSPIGWWYCIWKRDGNFVYSGDPVLYPNTPEVAFPTLEAAKAAAQADYAASILSAITTTTAASVRAEALREGYDLGFANSGEGYNGEYGADVTGDYYIQRRAEAILALIDPPDKSE